LIQLVLLTKRDRRVCKTPNLITHLIILTMALLLQIPTKP
jgi:hypothetical protein